MVRPLAFVLAMAIVVYPAQAAGPLVLIAKQLVQQIIVDFIEARVADTIRAAFGPCKQDLAEDAIQGTRAAMGMLRGGGGGGLSSLGAVGNLGSLGSLSSAAGAMGGAPSAAAALGAAGTAGTMVDQATSLGAVAGGAASGLGALGIAVPGMGGAGANELSQLAARMPGMQAGAVDPQQMAAIQQMMTAKPLDAAELDELAVILERFGKVAETIEPGSGCSAGDYRRLFTRMTVMSADPRLGGMMAAMTGGMLRTMYTSFKQMEQSTAEAERTFRQMSADDRAAYIDAMAAEWTVRPPEERRAALGMLDAGLLGVPDDMRATLRDRLVK
jgi:hypothetical protein